MAGDGRAARCAPADDGRATVARVAALLAALALAAGGCGGGGGAPAASSGGGCRLSVDVVPVPAGALRGRVPADLELARFPGGRAALDVWVLECRRMPLGPSPRRPGALALVGAVLAGPAGPPGAALTPRTFAHHLLSAHASRPEHAAALRAAGLPATAVPGLRTRRAGGRRVTRVDALGGGFVVSAPLAGRRDRPHDHHNVWWHADRDGGRAGLVLRVRAARDVFCPAERCGTVAARAGPMRRLLGAASRRAHASLDHEPIDPVLTLLRQQR